MFVGGGIKELRNDLFDDTNSFCRVELGERDASMSVLNEDMTSKYKIIEDLQNEVTELQQQAAVAPHGVVETDGDMVRLQQVPDISFSYISF